MGKTLNSFKGGTSTNKIIGTTFGLVNVAGKLIAPGLASENIVKGFRAGGIWGLPSAIANLWLVVGFFATTITGIYAPVTALVVVAVWAKWFAASKGVKLTVASGFEAFKKSIWQARRGAFWALLAAPPLGLAIGLFSQLPLMTGIGVGTSNSLAGVSGFIGGAIYFVGWKMLVTTSIKEAIAGNGVDNSQIFLAQLLTTLAVPAPALTADLIHYDAIGGFSIYPVPLGAIKQGMQEGIRKRALEHMPEYELIAASASHIQFAVAGETTLAARAVSEASGGAVLSRSTDDSASVSYFSPEDFE